MLLWKNVHRSALIGGGSALFGWAASECLGLRDGLVWGLFGESLTCGLIGGAIGAGVNIAADGIAANKRQVIRCAMAGLLVGAAAGVIGASIGHALVGVLSGARVLGLMLTGMGIGAAEGLHERSLKTLRRGVIAGAVGGLVGGLPFAGIYRVLSPLTEAGSRATAFVMFGSCVGASIGLAQAVFARAKGVVVDVSNRGPRPTSGKPYKRPLPLASPALETKPRSVAAPSSPSKAVTAAKRQSTGMTPCPNCKRPVPGTRPFCVVCKISF